MIKKLLFSFCIALSALQLTAQPETFPINGAANKNHTTYAFTNATIFVDFETKIKNATLLIKDGQIINVAEKLTIPADAVVYDLKGKYIYPSFLDPFCSFGFPELKKPGPRTTPIYDNQTKGAANWNQAIKPEVDASRIYVNDQKSIEELRKIGFGAAFNFNRDGIARGTGILLSLSDGNENETILNNKAAAVYSFEKGSSPQENPESLIGAIALLRQTYLDAEWYKRSMDKKEFNPSLEAWNNNQMLPQIFEVRDKLSVSRADKIGDEFKTQYIIKGAGDEYQRIDDIKGTHAKFIIPLNFPLAYDVDDPYDAYVTQLHEMKHWEMAPANPAFLEQANVPFAFTTADLKDRSANFWKNIRKAIANGLSEQQALKALTYAPAELLNYEKKLGSLKTGMIANFLICSGNLFDEKNILFQNWVNGTPYMINDINMVDIRGTYDLNVAPGRAYVLKITGDIDKPKATVIGKDTTTKNPVSLNINGRFITMGITLKESKNTIRLSGTINENPLSISGKGQLADGSWFDWFTTLKSPMEVKAEKKDSVKKELPKITDVPYPFGSYGLAQNNSLPDSLQMSWDAILIKNTTVWTNEPEGILKNKDVLITAGKITKVADNIPAPAGKTKVIQGEGKHLSAGIIDEHSHIAVNGGVNEGSQASSAEVRIGDAINCDDINIYRQLAGGVVASQLLHGSANPIGGQSALIKLRWGKSPEEMKIKGADGFIKFALGENVKQSNWGENFTLRFPQTRMGVEQVYVDHFTRAKEYDEKIKRGIVLRRNLDLETLAEILNKKRFITCHSYVQSEINMLMHVADSFGFKVNTFTHILEGYKVADKMKKHGVGGSTFADWWAYKMEVKEAIPYNGAIMNKMGIVTAFNSDDAEMGRRLNQEAAKAVKYGNVSEEEALKFVTLNPAKLLHLDNHMGSIKVGKDADVVLWSDNPLSVYARAEKTIIDGVIYYDMDRDEFLRNANQKERARLIQKLVKEKASGSETQKPASKPHHLDGCDTHLDDYITN